MNSTDTQHAVGHEVLPSETDVAFYREHGWYISEPLFSDEQIDAVVVASDRFYRGERDGAAPIEVKPFLNWKPEYGLDLVHDCGVRRRTPGHRILSPSLQPTGSAAITAMTSATYDGLPTIPIYSVDDLDWDSFSRVGWTAATPALSVAWTTGCSHRPAAAVMKPWPS